MPLSLASPAFADGKRIPKEYTCEGGDTSPPLRWSGAPKGTRSFLLVCNDPDAPGGLWHHWALYDLPPERDALAEGEGRDGPGHGARQAINDFKRPGYGGPCPPHGHGDHHYHFRLSALDVAVLDVPAKAHCAEVIAAAAAHVIESVELVGIYSR